MDTNSMMSAETKAKLSAQDYASTNSIHQQRAFSDLLSAMDFREGMKGLDIGCGTGVNTAIVAAKVGSSGSVTVIQADCSKQLRQMDTNSMMAAETKAKQSAQDYSSTNSIHQQRSFSNLLSAMDVGEGMKGLDIGCGTGVNTAIVAAKVGTSGSVTGLDLDDARINLARSKYKHMKNLTFVTGRSVDLSAEEKYDFIVSYYVMHWVPQDEKIETYEKIFSGLKPGGIFGSIESKKIADEYERILTFAPKEKREKVHAWYHFVSLERSREIFENIGFEIVCLKEVVYEDTLDSLDTYFKWFSAILHGVIDSREIYETNRENIKLNVNKDGSVKQKYWTYKIILRKPF